MMALQIAKENFRSRFPASAEENPVKKSMVWALALLSMISVASLSGCKDEGKKQDGIVVTPKWKGSPYRLTIDTKAAKPGAKAALIPALAFTANPDALERRATMIVRFDSSIVKGNQQVINQIILTPFDVQGPEGKIPAETLTAANKGLAELLAGYKVKGKVKVKVALERSSLARGAGESEIVEKHLSDWLEIEADFKGAK